MSTIIDQEVPELTTCPTCGGAAELIRFKAYKEPAGLIADNWKVVCDVCGLSTKTYKSKIYQNKAGDIVVEANGALLAAEAWNATPESETDLESDNTSTGDDTSNNGEPISETDTNVSTESGENEEGESNGN